MRIIDDLINTQGTLFGYKIEHLVTIARILQKEGLKPDNVAEALTDFSRIVAIVRAEFEVELKKGY